MNLTRRRRSILALAALFLLACGGVLADYPDFAHGAWMLTPASDAAPLPVTGAVTSTVTGTVAITGPVTVTGTVTAILPPADTLYDGTLTATTTAAPLSESRPVLDVTVQNDPNNTEDVLVGAATSQSMRLQPGASETLDINDPNKVWVKTGSGAAVVNHHERGLTP